MTDAVASLGGLTPRDLGLMTFRKSQRPILPPSVDRILTIPGLHGAYDYGASLGPRQLELECAFATPNYGELQRRISAFAAHLVDGDGQPRTMPLIFSAMPDRQYMVRYSGSLPIERIAGLGTFMLPLVAFDPFAYNTFDSTEIDVDSDLSVDSDMSVDAEYEFALTEPTSLAIDNYGNQNVRPVIEITGSFTSLALTVGGVTTTYTAPMSGTLVLDFAMRTAKVNGVNVLGNTNGLFGGLPVGISNIVVGGTGISCSIAVRFKGKYV